jgi:hypothetical protein
MHSKSLLSRFLISDDFIVRALSCAVMHVVLYEFYMISMWYPCGILVMFFASWSSWSPMVLTVLTGTFKVVLLPHLQRRRLGLEFPLEFRLEFRLEFGLEYDEYNEYTQSTMNNDTIWYITIQKTHLCGFRFFLNFCCFSLCWTSYRSYNVNNK